MVYRKKEPKRDPVWDYKNNPELEGIYESFVEDVGPHHSMLYKIKQLDGSVIAVWGCKILDERFSETAIGSQVKILYLGDITQSDGSKYHNFELWVDEDEQPESEQPSGTA